MAEVARHGRRERPGHSLRRAQFLPCGEEGPQPITADYHPGDDTFVRTMGNLLGPPLLEGNKVTPLQNGDRIFPAMLSHPLGGADDHLREFPFGRRRGLRRLRRGAGRTRACRGEGAFPPGRHGVQLHPRTRDSSCSNAPASGRNLSLCPFHHDQLPDTSQDPGHRRKLGSSVASASRMTGEATGGPKACGATRTTEWKGPPSRNCSRPSSTTGWRPGPNCSTAIFIFRNSKARRDNLPGVQKLSRRRLR